MFTAIRSPKDSNILYGVLNDLTKFDLKEQKVIHLFLLKQQLFQQEKMDQFM